jgi:uncharacterized protein (TIGR02266 family)
MTVKDMAAALRRYLSYRQRMRANDALSEEEEDDFEDLADLIGLFIERKAGERPGIELQGTGQKRRGALRLPMKLEVTLTGASDLRECMALNISEGGLFLATAGQPLPTGTDIDLGLYLEEDQTHLELTGTVQWLSTGNEGVLPQGMGIRFVDLSPTQNAALARFIDGQTEALIDLMM